MQHKPYIKKRYSLNNFNVFRKYKQICPDALPDATLTIYPGLGPALEIYWLVLPSGWVLTLIPRDNLASPINLNTMFWGDGRKLEYLERTYTYRTCKLHTERSQPGIEPGTLLLWGKSANHHTTMQPLAFLLITLVIVAVLQGGLNTRSMIVFVWFCSSWSSIHFEQERDLDCLQASQVYALCVREATLL